MGFPSAWIAGSSLQPGRPLRAGPGCPAMTKEESNDDQKRKGSGTPANALSHARAQAACGTRHGERRLAPPSACGRARLPAFHRGSHQRDFRPEGSASGQASRKRRQSCGVPHAPSRSQRSTSRAGRNAGRHDARAARVRSVSFRPRAPHSLRRPEVPSQTASFESETGRRYCHRGGEVKRRRIFFDESGASRRTAFRERRGTRMIRVQRTKNSPRPHWGEAAVRESANGSGPKWPA
jgi:hypothetical protein